MSKVGDFYSSCMLGRASQTNETLPDFCENMNPNKWDTTVWYRVTQNPQEFCRLTGYQRDPWKLGRHIIEEENGGKSCREVISSEE